MTHETKEEVLSEADISLIRYALDSIDDLVSDYLYYDRKECDSLPVGKIEELISEGKLTVADIVTRFELCIRTGTKQ